MSLHQERRRTRRSILVAAAGGAAGLAAARLAGPEAVAAANPPVYLNQDNPATATTTITGNGIHTLKVLTGTQATAIWGFSGSGVGVYAESDIGGGLAAGSNSGTGVNAWSTSGFGVDASSQTGIAVRGWANGASGVAGLSGSATKPAILGVSGGANTGVQGYSGTVGTEPAAPLKTGVYGYAAQDATARGVTGRSTAGYGVNGTATSGRGVHGQATTGYGVRGYATTGSAGYFATPKPAGSPYSGYALRAVGRVKLDQCAGVATIAATKSSVTVTPGIDLESTSAVVATLQGNAGGSTTVQRVAVNTTANTFTIYLTANSTADVKVAWHVFG